MLKTIKLYETPDMKVFEMHPESGMLTVTSTNFGEEGVAGAPGIIIGGGDENYY